VVFFNRDNAFGRREHTRLEQLVVWGGCVANCGEDDLSRLCDKHAAKLRTLTYVPNRTKGGALIRPKYHKGDRAGRQSFPLLTDMAIRAMPLLLPFEFGWDTPQLRELTLLINVCDKMPSVHQGQILARLREELRDVLSLEGDQGFVRRLHATCPTLERVHIEAYRPNDETRTQLRLLTIHTPNTSANTPWSVLRLLHLVATKPDQYSDEHTERCHEALRQAIPLMMQHLVTPPWRVSVASAPSLPDDLGALQLKPFAPEKIDRAKKIAATISSRLRRAHLSVPEFAETASAREEAPGGGAHPGFLSRVLRAMPKVARSSSGVSDDIDDELKLGRDLAAILVDIVDD